jgi:hypothetical protein
VRLGDRDPLLRQFERDAVVVCGVMTVAALAVGRGRIDGAVGVVAGALLCGVSYWALKGAADLVVGLASRARGEGGNEPPLPAGNRVILALKFFSRYALLAAAAYAMLRWFSVHPVGLLAGASTPFVAAAVQAARSFKAPSHREHP